MNALGTENVKIDDCREKAWFTNEKTSSSWEEGDRRSPMSHDPSETLEPYRKYLKVLADLHLDRKTSGQARPLRSGPADPAAGVFGPGARCATPSPRWLSRSTARAGRSPGSPSGSAVASRPSPRSCGVAWETCETG